MAMRWRVDRRIARAGTADTPRRRLRAQADRRRITRGRRRATRADRLRTIRVRLLPTNRLCAETMTPAFAAPALSCVAVPAGLEPATLCFEGRCSIRLRYGTGAVR